jgi:hypothetical protein
VKEHKSESLVGSIKGILPFLTIIFGLLTAVITFSSEILKSGSLWKQLWQSGVGQAPGVINVSDTGTTSSPARLNSSQKPTTSPLHSVRKSCQLKIETINRGDQYKSPIIVLKLVDVMGPLANRTIEVYEVSMTNERVRLASSPTGETGLLTLPLPNWDGKSTLLAVFTGDIDCDSTSLSIKSDLSN